MKRFVTENQGGSARNKISRRAFIQGCAAGTVLSALNPVLAWTDSAPAENQSRRGPAVRSMPLNQWLFGGKFDSAALAANFNDDRFSPVTIPHCVARLSWQNWDPAAWEDVWIYRRHFRIPDSVKALRAFLCFDGVMVGAAPSINGHALPEHLGGYLPFRYEISNAVVEGDNELAIAVDSRWSNVPPEGAPGGPAEVDYLEAGGIYRAVRLEFVPQVFISDVFAKPVQVLNDNRSVEVVCALNATTPLRKAIELRVELKDGTRIISQTQETLQITTPGETETKLVLSHIGNIEFWHVDSPHLYDVVTTLLMDGTPIHDYRVRIGFREARFELNGFFLNGKRLQLFGLDRHEIYPYVGGAMPSRVLRHDAQILRREFNCNIVRCSHYPQSEAFLDACDELGLMVWEEVPGWWYVGDQSWKDRLVRDVTDMVVRDRNRPSVVIWGVRANETPNEVTLYKQTTEIAKALDDSRPTSGSMTPWSRKNWQQEWHEDVFAFDDYHRAQDGGVGIDEPVPGVPYLVTEAVGQFDYDGGKEFHNTYRRAGDLKLQQEQALWHAQAHSRAATNPRICGVIAWCGFDYASLINAYHAVKCPGVADVFRIPKLGASFYQAQIDPKVRPVIWPNFYWNFGPRTPHGPGLKAAIFSNCDRLEISVGGAPHSKVYPDRANFPNLKHPPLFADLELDGTARPELRIDGYLGDHLALSRSFSSDPSADQLLLEPDDKTLIGDGVDATRLVVKIVDKFGAERAFASGEVKFEITGPGIVVGDNPFSLLDSGGVGAVWIKTLPNRNGTITVEAQHSALGTKIVNFDVQPFAVG